MHKLDAIPGRTVKTDGNEYLYFSGTSYLGMGCNEAFSELITEGIKKYGNNYSSSRISNLQLKIVEEAEEYLCHNFGSEAALTMSSGYMAGQIVVQMLLAKQIHEFIYAPGTHPALWRTSEDFFAGNHNAWAERALQGVIDSRAKKLAILCNALDPLYAEKHAFDWISELPHDKEVVLVIDDSHGLGVTGQNGRGVLSELKVPENVTLIVVSSLGKALGIPGGVIFSTSAVIGALKKSAFFGGSSPIAPAYLFAFLRAGTIYQKAREKLLKNVSMFSLNMNNVEQFRFIPGYPVYYTKNRALAEKLLEKEILISSFPYPTVDDDWVTRIIISSLHTASDIEALVAGLKS